jgi:hypothetical protein
MVTAELKEAEMFNPKTLAKHDAENKMSQYEKYIPLIPSMALPISTNVAVCIADKPNSNINEHQVSCD